MPERVTVGARPEIAGLEPAVAALLRGRPRAPPVAAELLELVERARAVDERAQLADRLGHEALDRALRYDRRAVGHRKAHGVAGHCECLDALLGGDPRARVPDRAEHVPVLAARPPLFEREVV